MKFQVRRQLYLITEWKDDCVYRTKSLKEVWIDMDNQPLPPENHQFGSLSTSRMMELGIDTMRKVDNDTPSIVDCED